jgi:Na+-transporting NADH:ubiquinone oxidoreductase subunit C
VSVDTNRPVYIIVFTALISAGFTAAVMTVQEAAAERIRRNEALRYEKALVEVFSLAQVSELSDEQIAQVVKEQIDTAQTVRDPQSGREFQLIRAYRSDVKPSEPRSDSDLLGIAFKISGTGFWAPIRGLMALKPDLSEITGVVFLEQKETPGLGGRITEAAFLKQFKGLQASPPSKDNKFFYVAKDPPEGPGDPRHERCVDAITGATQTCLALERFINRDLAALHRAMQAESEASK